VSVVLDNRQGFVTFDRWFCEVASKAFYELFHQRCQRGPV